ncbi:DUF3858 domain-containing protein, partial [Bacteroides acidifaciens]
GYRLITLPHAKTGIAMNGYGSGNTERTTNLLLPGMTDETYICVVNVPSDMQVCTPQKAKEITNAVGKLKITVHTTGDKTEVTRSLQL